MQLNKLGALVGSDCLFHRKVPWANSGVLQQLFKRRTPFDAIQYTVHSQISQIRLLSA